MFCLLENVLPRSGFVINCVTYCFLPTASSSAWSYRITDRKFVDAAGDKSEFTTHTYRVWRCFLGDQQAARYYLTLGVTKFARNYTAQHYKYFSISIEITVRL